MNQARPPLCPQTRLLPPGNVNRSLSSTAARDVNYTHQGNGNRNGNNRCANGSPFDQPKQSINMARLDFSSVPRDPDPYPEFTGINVHSAYLQVPVPQLRQHKKITYNVSLFFSC